MLSVISVMYFPFSPQINQQRVESQQRFRGRNGLPLVRRHKTAMTVGDLQDQVLATGIQETMGTDIENLA